MYSVSVPPFKTSDAYKPTGDQPRAIAELSEGLRAGERFQTMLGATAEIVIDAPNGIEIQLQDVSYCRGRGPLGNVCS